MVSDVNSCPTDFCRPLPYTGRSPFQRRRRWTFRKPYWKKNSLGGTQIWYTDLPDCPFDVPDMGEKDERAVNELKQLAEKYRAGEKGPRCKGDA